MNQEPPQPSHRLSTCKLHPDENFTGFCTSCLRERLAGLDQAIATATATHLKTSTTTTTTSALKAIFRGSTGDSNRNKPSSSTTTSSASFFSELRRTKSFSGGKGEGFSGVFEPQRKSCDVRVRSTLWSLFNQDDERKVESKRVWGEIEVETSNLELSGVGGPVFESREEEEEEEEEEIEEEVRVPQVNAIVENSVEEIVEEEEEIVEEEEEVKTMKDHIDLDSQTKKPPTRDLKEIAGSFWSAASVLSKKLQKWRRKEKTKKRRGCDEGSGTMQVEKPYSEIADYGFGRRSCDTDPRFSLDACRMSFDDPRFSWDEPRASWDGHLIGRTFPRLPPMVSVVEEAPVPVRLPPMVSVVEEAPVPVRRSDNLIPVEERVNSINEDDTSPGGSAQTRDYYSDSLHRRRRSLDRSNSIRKKAASVVAECDETKSVSNAKVSPAAIDHLPGTKFPVTDGDLKDSNSNSLRDDCSESFESGFRDAASIVSGVDGKGSKKSRRWSKGWNIWSLIHRRSGSKYEEEERYCRGNGVERSFSESWQELRREPNGEAKGTFNRIFRSNSSVSSRNSFNTGTSLGGIRRSAAETNGHGNKRKDDFMLERNRSARYSPNDLDNGLLRFYLTPLRSRRSGSVTSRSKNSHSIASSVMRLY